MAQTSNPLDLLFPEDVSKLLGVSTSTLSKWRITTNEGPAFIKLGNHRVAYARQDLEAWLASRRRRSTSDVGAAA